MLKSFNKPALAGLLALLVLGNAGCTRALRADYRLDPAPAVSPRGATVGVARFKDERAWVVPGEEKSSSFISSAGAWKFGISEDGTAYTPVNRYVQSVIVQELGRAGIVASALEHEYDGVDAQAARTMAGKQDYLLGGKIQTFEFANDAGMVTVTSRRTINLQITLLKTATLAAVRNSSYQETEAENEGMGVMHSTNVDKLVNGTLRKAVQKIVSDVSTNLALHVGEVQVVGVDGATWTYAVDAANNVSLALR